MALTYDRKDGTETLFDFISKHKEYLQNPQELKDRLVEILGNLEQKLPENLKQKFRQAILDDIDKREQNIDDTKQRIKNLIDFFKPKSETTQTKKITLLPTDFLLSEKSGVTFFTFGGDSFIVSNINNPHNLEHEFLHSVVNPIEDKLSKQLTEDQKQKISTLGSHRLRVEQKYGDDFYSLLCEEFIRTYNDVVQKGEKPMIYEDFVQKINEIDEPRNFDISNIDWFGPLLVLPISAHINCFGSKFIKPDNSYLDAISFPLGVDTVSVFEKQVQIDKSYIPISVLKKNKGADRERLESLFLRMIYKTLGSVVGAQNAVYHPISEIVTNIFEHSKQEQGFIFGQFYPQKNYLDICIIDCGRGIAKVYEDEKNLKLSDSDAIREVLKGNSTKPERSERGFGVRTSKRVVCEGLGGEFILLSGSSAFIASGNKEKLVDLPGFNWRGVVVAYRIPKPEGTVDINPFLE